MAVDDIFLKWRLRETDKKASVDLWDSMARGFGESPIPTFEDNQFLRLLRAEHMFCADSSVLDVGCGTGSYALALAPVCAQVVGVDFSPGMIGLAAQRAAREGLRNVRFERMDWHGAALAEAGFYKQFDLVLAHMTPAVQSAETFQKLSDASRGFCALTKPTRRTDPVSDRVKQLVGITEKRESSDTDILYAFELLWRQGLEPRLHYERQRWSMKKTPEEAHGLYINRVKTYRAITEAEEREIKAYLASVTRDGLVCEEVDTTVTTIYWHV